jgi:hypothetical protein
MLLCESHDSSVDREAGQRQGAMRAHSPEGR